jgi:hypothetical protein
MIIFSFSDARQQPLELQGAWPGFAILEREKVKRHTRKTPTPVLCVPVYWLLI